MKNSLWIIFSLLYTGLSAQVAVSGKVLNEQGQPIEYAEVLLKTQNDSTQIAHTLTNKTGDFSLSVTKGNYTLSVDYFGEEVFNKKISLVSNANLGTLKVKTANVIGKVTVTGKKPLIERKADRFIFNVASSLYAKGGTALDALKVTPRLQVEEDEVSMIGRSKLLISLNGRIIHLSDDELPGFLKSIPAENIASIEVISTLPAKYEAEGNAGMINIVLKKNPSKTWSANLSTSYLQSSYPTGETSNGFNYMGKKLSFYGSLSAKNGSTKDTGKDEIYYKDDTRITNFNRRVYTDRVSSRFNLDYKLTKNLNVGVQYAFSKSKPWRKSLHEYMLIQPNDPTRKEDTDSIRNSIKNTSTRPFNNLNLYTTLKLDSLGRKINLEFTYLDYNNDNHRSFNAESYHLNPFELFESQSNQYDGSQNIHNYIGKVDVEHPFKKLSLTYGMKFSNTQTDNELESQIHITPLPDKSMSGLTQQDVFKYDETITALYVSGERKFGKKWSSKLGLRVENTTTKGNSVSLDEIHKDHYTELFPTFYLNYSPNTKNTFSLDYSRRISRPSFYQLNPFQRYYSPYSYNKGNPYLQAVFINSLKVEYWRSGNFGFMIWYDHLKQGFDEVPIMNKETKIQYFTYLNFYKEHLLMWILYYEYNHLKWWESYNTIAPSYFEADFDQDASVSLKEASGWGLQVSSRNAFTLNKKKTLKGEVYFKYYAPRTSLIYQDDGRCRLNLSLQAFLLKDKNLNIGLYANDILRTYKSRSVTRNNDIRQVYSHYWDEQRIKLTLRYTFGNKKVRAHKKDFGNEQEKERLN